MGIFAAYDTVGIQEYIFSTNKLRENVGASKLVAYLFNELLPEILKKHDGVSDWRKPKQPGLNLNGGELAGAAEMVYQGGGNAFVVFRDEDTFQKITKEFVTRVDELTCGVGIAVAAVETDFGETYKDDYQRLMQRLNQAKGKFNIPFHTGNLPITKQSVRSGLPVVKYDFDEYIDESQEKKRDYYNEIKSRTPEVEKRIKEFDDLVFQKGDNSFIAIMHADGNNMSKRIENVMGSYLTYDKAVPAIRELSQAIDASYKTALANTVKTFETWFSKQYPGKEVPYLPLIADGDDITSVIGGKFALSFAALLLKAIEEQLSPFGTDSPLSACAGVVIFHSHYPFSEAYRMAEECCAQAKKAARDSGFYPSYLDFHLHQSGHVSSLKTLRKGQFTVENKELFFRPWGISDAAKPKFLTFENLEESFALWPRSRAKALCNAIGTNEHEAHCVAAQCKSRGVNLPELKDLEIPKEKSKYAPYFDVLELADVYVKIEPEVKENASD